MVSFELLYRDIKTTNLNTLQNENIKSKLLDTAFYSFDTFTKNKHKNNLSEIQLQALNSLLQKKDIIIRKAEKQIKATLLLLLIRMLTKRELKPSFKIVLNLKNLTFKKKSIEILLLIKKKGVGKLLNPCMKKVILLKVNF